MPGLKLTQASKGTPGDLSLSKQSIVLFTDAFMRDFAAMN